MERNFKLLANQYFEGKIAPEDERALFDFIAAGADNQASFRAWEAEWSARPHFDITTENAWQRFYAWMSQVELKRSRRPLWRMAAAVAVVLLMVGSAFLGKYVSDNAPVNYYTLTAPIGSKTYLTLPDGSHVWLNAGSTLSYSTNFGKRDRHVKLEGEGYFEVAKKDGEQFVVTTRGYDVVVKGTRFNVMAYNDDQYITTTLIQGAVLIGRGDDILCMQPGDMVRLDTKTGQLTKTRYTNDTHAWVQDMTEFNEITLEDLSKVLSRRYAVNINIQSVRLRHMRFSISLRNKETIDDVLDALQRITAMKVCRNGKEITISE